MEYTIKAFGKWWLLKDKATGKVIFKSGNRRDLDDYMTRENCDHQLRTNTKIVLGGENLHYQECGSCGYKGEAS